MAQCGSPVFFSVLQILGHEHVPITAQDLILGPFWVNFVREVSGKSVGKTRHVGKTPDKLTWIPKMAIFERKYLLQTIILGIHVGFRGCIQSSFLRKRGEKKDVG